MKKKKTGDAMKYETISYYEPGDRFSPEQFGKHLTRLICEVQEEKQKNGVLYLCIGSDRSTGDSLGPLIGYLLEKNNFPSVVGTLQKPGHAVNLEEAVTRLEVDCRDNVVVAIDARRREDGGFTVVVNGGRIDMQIDAIAWAKECEQRGAGEILLTSMDTDGCKQGFDLELTNAISSVVHIPVIASGGCGTLEHFSEVFEKTGADAALAASLFHFKELTVQQVKDHLRSRQIPVRR